MDRQFEVGDVVRLKSGSPTMTVEEIDGDKIICSWFDGLQAEQADFFAPMLMLEHLVP